MAWYDALWIFVSTCGPSKGLARVETYKVDLAEVADALYAPAGLRVEHRLGDLLLIVAGMAGTGRVIAVVCERIAGQHKTFKIMDARALKGEALDEWRRRLP